MTGVEVVLLMASGAVVACAGVLKFRGLGRRADVYVGVALVVFFSVLLLTGATGESSILDRTIDTEAFVVSAWILAVAYLVNAIAKVAIYPLRVTSDGDPTIPLLLQRVIGFFIYLIAAVVILQFVANQSVTAIATASGALALVIGYSSRNVLEELFAGLALYADEPFSKGDLIQVDGAWAIVKDMTWRSLTYIDMDENIVVLPNTRVAAAEIRNLDRPTRLVRRTIHFRVEYNVPPRVVIDECEAAIRDSPHVLDHPWNYVAFFETDEHGMVYRMAFYIADYNHWFVASDELFNAIWYRFARKQIRFAHQRKINYIDREDERRGLYGSAYDESNWQDLVDNFNTVPLLDGMTEEDMEFLAQRATLRILGPPERIVDAGSETRSLFLIASGIADLYEVNGDEETWMSSIEAPESIGLMSLLTGTPPRTTARARTEVAVWEIGSDSLHDLFERKPHVMNNVATRVAKWQSEEDEALNKIALSRVAEQEALAKRTKALSRRIAGFLARRSDEEDDIEAPESRHWRESLQQSGAWIGNVQMDSLQLGSDQLGRDQLDSDQGNETPTKGPM